MDVSHWNLCILFNAMNEKHLRPWHPVLHFSDAEKGENTKTMRNLCQIIQLIPLNLIVSRTNSHRVLCHNFHGIKLEVPKFTVITFNLTGY